MGRTWSSKKTEVSTLLVDAARLLCGVNMATSIPTFCKVVLTHRAIVDLLTIMCGLVKWINRAVRFRLSSPESS